MTLDLLDLEDDVHRRLSDELESELESGTLSDLPPRPELASRAQRILEGLPTVLTATSRRNSSAPS
jgi:hypothetical protein